LQRADDLARRVLQVCEVAGGEGFHGESGLDPEDVDRAVDAPAIEERNSDGRQPIVERVSPGEISVGRPCEAGVARG
jgi:hypothetical protein